VSFITKTVSPADSSVEIYRTTANTVRPVMNKQFFYPVFVSEEFIIMQKRPLLRDEIIELKLKQGRFQNNVMIHVFVSKFEF
jgi:hypothetical protein